MTKINPTTLQGKISIPPSKAISHRAYILAALSVSGTKIYNLLDSADPNATKECLERMGAEFKPIENGYELMYPATHGSSVLNCENSGTTLRLLTAIATLFKEETTLLGDQSLHTRPMKDLIDALEQLGAEIDSLDGKAPITVKSPLKEYLKECNIKGDISSQYISALLIMASVRGQNIETYIKLLPPLVSKPYVSLTEEMLKTAGARISKVGDTYRILGRSNLDQFKITVPEDYSSAAFFIVAGALPGNSISIKNIDFIFTQADAQIVDFVWKAGGNVREKDNYLLVSHRELNPTEFDISNCPDLFPILCVLAAATEGESKIYGAEHLRYKETDRISAMVDVLTKCGVDIEGTKDGAIIKGGKVIGGAKVDSRGDHRIAMAAAILATQAEKPVEIIDAECVNVSFPTFFEQLEKVSQS